jgi:hypothetical protein
MHGPMNVKSPNNTSKWQMRFNSAFKGLKGYVHTDKSVSVTSQVRSVAVAERECLT